MKKWAFGPVRALDDGSAGLVMQVRLLDDGRASTAIGWTLFGLTIAS